MIVRAQDFTASPARVYEIRCASARFVNRELMLVGVENVTALKPDDRVHAEAMLFDANSAGHRLVFSRDWGLDLIS